MHLLSAPFSINTPKDETAMFITSHTPLNGAIVAVVACCFLCVACEGTTAGGSGNGNDKSLQCVVEQAAADVAPTTVVLPDGNLLFNQLQYAINRCPFQELYIPPTTTNSLPIDCLTIANHLGPFLIRGAHSPNSKNRSTIVVNASSCAATERGALINIIATSDIVFQDIAVVVLNPVLPEEDQVMNTFAAIALDWCSNITFQHVMMDLVAQSGFELLGWGSLLRVNHSTGIQLYGGRFVATTMTYASSAESVMTSVDDDVTDDERGRYFRGGFPVLPHNLTYPRMTTILTHHTNGLSMIGTTLKISSDLGHIHQAHNVSNFIKQGCFVEVVLVLPPPMVSPTTNRTMLPPQAVLPIPVFISASSNIVITSTQFDVVCGVYCNKVLLSAVILIVSGEWDHHTLPMPRVEAVLIKDIQLNFVGPASSLVLDVDILPASSNFVVITSPSAECVIIDNVTTINAISIASNSVVMNSKNLSSSVLSRIQVIQAGLSAGLSMEQSMRYYPPPNPSSVLIWSNPASAPPVPLSLLQFSSLNCQNAIVNPPVSAAPSGSFWNCCTDQTAFWSGIMLLVLLLVSLSVFLFRRRSGAAKLEVAVAAAATTGVVHVQVSRDLLTVDDNVMPSMSDPLLPSDRSIARSGMSPRDESISRRHPRDELQVDTPKNAQARSGEGSACNSDMVLYMPAGDGGWNTTRSANANTWVWTPRAPGTENSGQNSLSANSMCSAARPASIEKSGADHRHVTPIISLSSPGIVTPTTIFHATDPQPKPMIVKSTADSTPFDNGRTRLDGDSVHSSQFSSSTEGDDDDDDDDVVDE